MASKNYESRDLPAYLRASHQPAHGAKAFRIL